MKKEIALCLTISIIGIALVACAGGNEPVQDAAGSATEIPSKVAEESPADPMPEEGALPAEVTPEAGAFSPRIEERACDLFIPAGEKKGETIQCGYVIVPAERDNPDSKEVTLAYVLLKATGENIDPDPIIHISGGPGISATSPGYSRRIIESLRTAARDAGHHFVRPKGCWEQPSLLRLLCRYREGCGRGIPVELRNIHALPGRSA